MKDADLNRAVARATGETISCIKQFGFVLDMPPDEQQEPDNDDLAPYTLDWDLIDAERRGTYVRLPDAHPSSDRQPSLVHFPLPCIS